MLNIRSEHMISLMEGPDHVPRFRGRKVHKSTIWRWVTRGVKDVRLETVRLGGRTYTSTEAIERFIEALSSLRAAQPTPRSVTKQKQNREISVELQLKQKGL